MLENIISIWQKYDFVFIQGLKVTVILSLITVFFGSILGCILAFLKISKFKVLNAIAIIYIEVLRGTPILLQLYFFWLFLTISAYMVLATVFKLLYVKRYGELL